jgi:hypothetical protein
MNADNTIRASGILIINVLHITQVRRSPNEIVCHCVLLSNSRHTWPGTINILGHWQRQSPPAVRP